MATKKPEMKTETKKQDKRKSKYDISGHSVRVGRSKAGLGLYAKDDIPKGICFIEYFGRVIKGEEEYTSNSKYLFEVHTRKTIDGRARENTARYINHSCKPNAEPETHKGRVFIFSKRNIKSGEEICYDYGKEYWNDHIKPYGCRCVKCA
jgi:SET domain-containing protein